jgi:hypothetical protein
MYDGLCQLCTRLCRCSLLAGTAGWLARARLTRRRCCDAAVASARDALSEQDFEEAWAEGAVLSPVYTKLGLT